MMQSFKRVFALLLAALVGACAPQAAEPTPTIDPDTLPKQLATVFISPTPDNAEQQATLLAAPRTTSTPAPSPTPAPTAYVGVFLGSGERADADPASGDIPIIDPLRYQGTIVANVPTVNAPTCVIGADPEFGVAWNQEPNVRDTIGCAGEPVTPYVGTGQVFERGVMYWLPSGEIYALVPGGAVGGRYWYVPQSPPEQGWEIVAPEGLRAPAPAFGALWRAYADVRQGVGFARTDEVSASLLVQRFDGGTLLRDSTSEQTFALIGGDENGVLYGPF